MEKRVGVLFNAVTSFSLLKVLREKCTYESQGCPLQVGPNSLISRCVPAFSLVILACANHLGELMPGACPVLSAGACPPAGDPVPGRDRVEGLFVCFRRD